MLKIGKLIFLIAIFVVVFLPEQSVGFPIATTQGREMSISTAFDGTNYLVAIRGDAASSSNITAHLIDQSGNLVGARISTGRTGYIPHVAFDGTRYLMVWLDDLGGSATDAVYGAFVTTAGAINIPFEIAPVDIDGVAGIAYGSGNYFVAYYREGIDHDSNSGTPPITMLYGRIVDPSGVMGSEFAISTGEVGEASIAFDGTNFLVMYNDSGIDANDPNGLYANNVFGRLVSPAGVLVSPEFVINGSSYPSDNTVSVAFDGVNYLAVWFDKVGSGEWDIFGQRVDKSGNIVGGVININTTVGSQLLPLIAFDGTDYLVVWTDKKNDANNNGICESSEGTCFDIYAQYISKSGVLIDEPFAISAGSGNEVGGLSFGGGKYLALINKIGNLLDESELFDFGKDIFGKFIEPQPHVALLTANGETIPSGATYPINWESHPDAVSFDIKYSPDKGITWSTVATGLTGTSFPSWSVPKSKNNKRRHLIKILGRNAAYRMISKDKSDRPFSIEVVKLTSPNGGETWSNSTSPHTITWTTNATKNPVASVKLYYTLNNGTTWKTIDMGTDTSDDGSFDWTVPGVTSAKTKCKVKVVLKDSSGNLGSDVSDAVFTISP